MKYLHQYILFSAIAALPLPSMAQETTKADSTESLVPVAFRKVH